MSQEPIFEVGQLVVKWTGDYTGPGIVRGIAGLENGSLRYLVGHRIDGGTGEFLHVYAEANLREYDPINSLRLVSKEDGLRSRTGQATPEGAQGTIGLQCPGAVGVEPTRYDELSAMLRKRDEAQELLDALATAHRQVDMLLAMVVTLDKSFMPSQSPLWPDTVKRVELIRKYEGTP